VWLKAGVLHRGGCGEREKKKQICAAGQTGRADPSRFISLQIEKKNYRDELYIAFDLGSPHGAMACVVWLGLVGRGLSRLRTFDPSPISYCGVRDQHTIFDSHVANCELHLPRGPCNFEGLMVPPLCTERPSFLLSQSRFWPSL
jgi:hypothetical protein